MKRASSGVSSGTSPAMEDWLNSTASTNNNNKKLSASHQHQQQQVSLNTSNNNNKHKDNTIRIFVSSTFTDMNKERDLIVSRVAPRITKFGESIGCTVSFVDLRWGVTTDQSVDTVAVCLDEVVKSDIVLVFSGSRYGWHVCSNDAHFRNKNSLEERAQFEEKSNGVLNRSIRHAAEMFGSSSLPFLKQLIVPSATSTFNNEGINNNNNNSGNTHHNTTRSNFLRKSSVTELEIRAALLKKDADWKNVHVFLRSSPQNQKSLEECPEARLRLDMMKNALCTLPTAKNYNDLSSSSSKSSNSSKNSDDTNSGSVAVGAASLPFLKSASELEESIVSSIRESIFNIYPERRNLEKPRKWERETQIQDVIANRSLVGFCSDF